jgi:hypothetical protein
MQRHRPLSREAGVSPRRQDRRLGIRTVFTNKDRGGEGIREGEGMGGVGGSRKPRLGLWEQWDTLQQGV